MNAYVLESNSFPITPLKSNPSMSTLAKVCSCLQFFAVMELTAPFRSSMSYA